MIVIGFHSVDALLKSDQRIRAVHILDRVSSERGAIVREQANRRRIPCREYAVKDKMKFESEFKKHGGTGAELESAQGLFAEIDDVTTMPHLELLRMAKESGERPLILYLDSITDPQNLGSIMRSAAFFGVYGLVLTEARSSPITATALKVSSGGFAHLKIAKVSNLVNALKEAKEEGFWIVGLSEHASKAIDAAHFDLPLGLVVGNEEKGIRQLTEKNCDFTLSLPGNSSFVSLNAAIATAVALSLVRDRQKS